MASVHLDFFPPDRAGFVKLYIFQAPSSDPLVPLVEIEQVTDIGAYPNYISEYTTNQATAVDYWFAIQWEDDKGARTDVSARLQGTTSTLIGKLVDRVMLSSPTLDENIVGQSAEFVVATIKNTEDPYDINITYTYRELEGMTLLTQAYAEIRSMSVAGESTGWTAGLVSMKSATTPTSRKELIDFLITQASKILGLNRSVIAQMIVPEIASGLSEVSFEDISRLEVVEIE